MLTNDSPLFVCKLLKCPHRHIKVVHVITAPALVAVGVGAVCACNAGGRHVCGCVSNVAAALHSSLGAWRHTVSQHVAVQLHLHTVQCGAAIMLMRPALLQPASWCSGCRLCSSRLGTANPYATRLDKTARTWAAVCNPQNNRLARVVTGISSVQFLFIVVFDPCSIACHLITRAACIHVDTIVCGMSRCIIMLGWSAWCSQD